MRAETRQAFNDYTAQIGLLNGGVDATGQFTVEPTVEQRLETRLQQEAAFLMEVNSVPVAEIKGQKVLMGTGGSIAGRTDTAATERTPRDIVDLTARDYEARKTDFDSHITYAQLDAWAKFPDFQSRARDHVIRQMARDRLTIGWRGTSAAATTNRDANPNLEDVNIGWLQQLRTGRAEAVVSGVKIGTVGGRDFRTLDGAVYDAIQRLIEPWHRESGMLQVILSEDLLADKYLGLIENHDQPTERQALAGLIMNKTVGGRRARTVPFFPARSILITMPSNLSIYWQTGSRRRQIQDQPNWDRIVDFQSVNEAYVIEDLEATCLLEGILLPSGVAEDDEETEGADERWS